MSTPSQPTRLALSLAGVVIFALLVGLGRELYARTFLARMIHQAISVTPDVPLTHKDPVYGERPVAGHFEVQLDVPESSAPYRFSMDIDADGYRETSPEPEEYAGLPEVWIFGCSFTWGYPLNNRDTYPWLVQQQLPTHRVRNYGVHGVGNLRALRQMRELLEERSVTPPPVAVFGYASFHKARNIKGASQSVGAEGSLSSHVLDYRELLTPEQLASVQLPPKLAASPDPEQERVTFAIFRELAALCRAHGIRPVLAVQHTGGFDPLLPFAESLGFRIASMEVDFRRAIYNLMPFDNHPNAEANQVYAQKLLPVVRSELARD